MTRLQKKCLAGVASAHLLAVVALLCSGFIKSSPKADNAEVLDMIPANVVANALNSGVRGAQLPPPTPTPPAPAPPVPQQQPQPQPQPPPPQPQPKPQPDSKPPEPVKRVEPVKTPERVQPDDSKSTEPTEPKPQRHPHEVKVNLTPVVRKTTTTTSDDSREAAKEAAAAERAAQRARAARERAVRNALHAIRDNTSSSLSVAMPGESSVASANYASIVKTVYTEAWILPNAAASDLANVQVSVTIANDGRVIDAHIVDRSGDGSVDSSVQRALDRVSKIEPFESGSTEKQRTYIINFNLKAKRDLMG